MGLLDDLRSGSAAAEASGGGNEYAPSWRWEQPGDGVEGVVVSVDRRKHDNHPDGYPIVTIRQADGTDIAVHCMATVLKNEVEEQRPRPGDEFACVFDGKKTGASGRGYNAFRVAIRPAGGTVPPPASAYQPPAQQAPQQPVQRPVQQAPVNDPWAASGSDDIPF